MNAKEFTPVWSDAKPLEVVLQVPRVLNVNQGFDGLYIGREMPASGTRPARAASEWANTEKLTEDNPEARARAVFRYCFKLLDNPERHRLGELAGFDLLCWCAPKLCHGDGIAALIAVTRFYGSTCPHCGTRVYSWLNWHAGLSRFTEAWVCQAKHCGRRGDAVRPLPALMLEAQPMLL